MSLMDIYSNVSSSKEFALMLKRLEPLKSYFRLSEFFYSKIIITETDRRIISFGMNVAWGEYLLTNKEAFENSAAFKSDLIKSGVYLMKNNSDFNDISDIAWKKFKINFVLGIHKQKQNTIEDFGFGLSIQNPRAVDSMLNHMPLINKFLSHFMAENNKLIKLASDNAIVIPCKKVITKVVDKEIFSSDNKEKLLYQLGLSDIGLLTPREIELLPYLAQGYPSSYIAEQLYLSKRTVENYICIIKDKLDCQSKISLIQRSQDLLVGVDDHIAGC
jgi:DNA-binding CsgD family transcriptional regulator